MSSVFARRACSLFHRGNSSIGHISTVTDTARSFATSSLNAAQSSSSNNATPPTTSNEAGADPFTQQLQAKTEAELRELVEKQGLQVDRQGISSPSQPDDAVQPQVHKCILLPLLPDCCFLYTG